MNKNKKFVLIIIFFAAVLVAAAFLYNALAPGFKQNSAQNALQSTAVQSITPSASAWTRTSESQATRMAAPDFTVYDASGKPVKLSDFKGKPVVINFWASWCPYCIQELPDFNAAFQSLGSTVQFMMIDVTDGQRETKDKGEAYIKSNGYTFPVFYDTSLEAAGAYEIQSLPSTLFIDKDGNIASGIKGALDQNSIQKGIALINP